MDSIGVGSTNYFAYLLFLLVGLGCGLVHVYMLHDIPQLRWLVKVLTNFAGLHLVEIGRCVYNLTHPQHQLILPFFVFVGMNIYAYGCLGLLGMYHSKRLRQILFRIATAGNNTPPLQASAPLHRPPTSTQ